LNIPKQGVLTHMTTIVGIDEPGLLSHSLPLNAKGCGIYQHPPDTVAPGEGVKDDPFINFEEIGLPPLPPPEPQLTPEQLAAEAALDEMCKPASLRKKKAEEEPT